MESNPKINISRTEQNISPDQEMTSEKDTKFLSGYLKEKFGDNFPKISLHFFSSPHATETDAEGIRERMNEADIFIPEISGWKNSTLDEIKKISAGEIRNLDLRKSGINPFFQPVFESLFESNIPVTIIDAPEETKREMEKNLMKIKIPGNTPFEEAAEAVSRVSKIESDIKHKEREKYMLSVIGPKIAEILENRPDLRQKEKINVLLTLGVAHTNIIKELSADTDIEVSKELRYSPTIFGFYAEMQRRYDFGKEISDSLKKKALIEILLSSPLKTFLQNSKNSATAMLFKRFLVEAFTEEELKTLYEEKKTSQRIISEDRRVFMKTDEALSIFSEHGDRDWMQKIEDSFNTWRKLNNRTGYDFEVLFEKHLQEKGLNIPKNDEEAIEIMQRYKHDT